MKTAAIICIGDELLDGRITDTNARHLMKWTQSRALDIGEMRIVGDDRELIAATLSDVADYDLIVVSGGLGPTRDDVTRRAAADFAGVELVEDDDALRRLQRRFERRDRTFTDNNRRQCQFPDGADVLISDVGTADGFELHADDTDVVFFPGVPREFRWFVEHHLQIDDDQNIPTRRVMTFFGRGESDLETMIDDVAQEAADRGVSVGFRAEFPVVDVVLRGDDDAVDDIEKAVDKRLGRWLVATDGKTAMEQLADQLTAGGYTVSVAESCTAGMLAAKLTEISGSSAYFEEGYLTYANRAKHRLVDVDEQLLEAYGAVSPQVVCQMAAGARNRSEADFAAAISGIAGPSGGTAEKPVGTVDIALADPTGTFWRRHHFPQRSRRDVRVLSVYAAISALLWRLDSRLDEHRWNGPFSYVDVEIGAVNDTTRKSTENIRPGD